MYLTTLGDQLAFTSSHAVVLPEGRFIQSLDFWAIVVSRRFAEFGHWDLVIDWTLVIGIWDLMINGMAVGSSRYCKQLQTYRLALGLDIMFCSWYLN